MIQATDAGIHDYLMSLEDGYETQLGSADGILSPQRTNSLGEIYIPTAKIMVLDEPN